MAAAAVLPLGGELKSDDHKLTMECLICTERRELRLITCNHLICTECLEKIISGARKAQAVPQCPFCRYALGRTALDYPLCRMDSHPLNELDLLTKALSETDVQNCEVKDCPRHIDRFCGRCVKFTCYRCSTKERCEVRSGVHALNDFDEQLQICKEMFEKWKYAKFTNISVLSQQQSDLVSKIKRDVSDSSDSNLLHVLDSISTKRSLLQETRRRLAEDNAVLQKYNEDIGSVSKTNFIRLVSHLSCGGDTQKEPQPASNAAHLVIGRSTSEEKEALMKEDIMSKLADSSSNLTMAINTGGYDKGMLINHNTTKATVKSHIDTRIVKGEEDAMGKSRSSQYFSSGHPSRTLIVENTKGDEFANVDVTYGSGATIYAARGVSVDTRIVKGEKDTMEKSDSSQYSSSGHPSRTLIIENKKGDEFANIDVTYGSRARVYTGGRGSVDTRISAGEDTMGESDSPQYFSSGHPSKTLIDGFSAVLKHENMKGEEFANLDVTYGSGAKVYTGGGVSVDRQTDISKIKSEEVAMGKSHTQYFSSGHPSKTLTVGGNKELLDTVRVLLDTNCYCVHAPLDLLLIGQDAAFLSQNAKGENFTSVYTGGVVSYLSSFVADVTINVHSIQLYDSNIYTLAGSPHLGNRRNIIVYESATHSEIRRWPVSNYHLTSNMAVRNYKVYVSDPNSGQLSVYNLLGKPLKPVKHTKFASPVYIATGGPNSIIITDSWTSSHNVHKLDCEADTITWSSTVDCPKAVCTHTDGDVWVWSSIAKSLFILHSDSGQVKQEVKHEMFTSLRVHGMAIAEDCLQLYLATSHGLLRFEM